MDSLPPSTREPSAEEKGGPPGGQQGQKLALCLSRASSPAPQALSPRSLSVLQSQLPGFPRAPLFTDASAAWSGGRGVRGSSPL